MTDNLTGTKLGSTRSICEYITHSSYDDLSDEVVNKAKMAILDSLGCAIGGSTLEPAGIFLDFFTELEGKPEATLIPKGPKVPAINATYANAQLANLMDFDDTLRGHPGACLVPPALAVAERIGASGRELINAVTLAYEVQTRIAEAITASPQRDKQVRGVATHEIFAAATAASALLHLDTDTTTVALSSAGRNAPVPSIWKMTDETPKSWLKFNFGWAAMGGVMAALLAERGLIDSHAILDGDRGFWVMAGSDQCKFAEMTRRLGQEYRIMELEFKPYPSCRFTHCTVEAIKQILAEHDISAGSIEKVHVKSISMLGEFTDPVPTNCVDAQFSLPYVAAMALLGRLPESEWLSEASLNDPEALGIARKVVLEVDPEAERIFYEKNWTQMPTTVTVLAKGKEFKASYSTPRNLNDAEIEEKFRRLSAPVLGSSVTEELIKAVKQLQDLTQVASLCRLFK